MVPKSINKEVQIKYAFSLHQNLSLHRPTPPKNKKKTKTKTKKQPTNKHPTGQQKKLKKSLREIS